MEFKELLEVVYPGIEVESDLGDTSHIVKVRYQGVECEFEFDIKDAQEMILEKVTSSLNQSLLNIFTEELAKCVGVDVLDVEYTINEDKMLVISIMGGEFSAPMDFVLGNIKEEGVKGAAELNFKYICYEAFGVNTTFLADGREESLAKTSILSVPTGTYAFKDGFCGYIRALNMLSEMDLDSKSLVTAINRVGNVTGFIGRCAKFEKVSREQFLKDNGGEGYDKLQLPKRATSGSAGYDFFAPFNFTLDPGESRVIPTGMRCCMLDNYVLQCYPRSGHGFKYFVRLANTVGIIDSDYYNSKNEGHIMIKLVNTGDKILVVKEGEAFCQGIFTQFGLTIDDDADGIRDGGFGSTSK